MSPDFYAIIGGTVLDVADGSQRECTIVIGDGIVADILPPDDAKGLGVRVVDVHQALVVPGFVDLHCHVFTGVGESVDPDLDCLRRGTVVAVDAGSAGAATVDAFARQAAGQATRIKAWLNLSTIGLADPSAGELLLGPHLDVDRAIESADRHRGFVIGMKARLSSYAAGHGIERVLRALRSVADAVSLPVMVHVGDTDEPIDSIVAHLQPGDVVTHALTGRKHGLVDARGRLEPSIRAAQSAGVVFDAARGRNHLSFDVMAAALEQGFLPDTLSTDITVGSGRDQTYGMSTVGTDALAMGVPLHTTLSLMTSRPAAVVGVEGRHTVTPGMPADLTVVAVDHGSRVIQDTDGRARRTSMGLRAVGAVRAGTFYPAVSTGP